MPFEDADKFYGPLAVPDGMDLNPDIPDVEGNILTSAFRTENVFGSYLNSYRYDDRKPFDPDYRPWDDIQGTPFEAYSERFSGARDRDDVVAMKDQIEREQEDRAVLDAGGPMGFLSQIGAAILSPTTALPGGFLIKGAKGVSIGKTGLTVAGSAALAAALDEAVLQGTQETRTAGETAFAIGGSFILGGMLGAAAGKMAKMDFDRSAVQTEEFIKNVNEYQETLRSVGAADVRPDLELRREQIFSTIDKIPALRAFVRSDPVLRGQLSPLYEARRATAELVETPLQYKINEEGRSVREGGMSVEGRILDREHNELAKSIAHLQRSFAEYSKDGPVGTIGTLTAPITARYRNLMGKDKKLNSLEFMEEVGKAMRRGDKHPIPQVQSAADALRREVFDRVKDDAIEVGIFDPDLQVTNADSYFTRVYKTEKISQNKFNDTENDLAVVLRSEFRKRRDQAKEKLAFDRSVDELESARFRESERARTAQSALDKAVRKIRAKRDRAEAAVKREGAVGRVSGSLRKAFKDRAKGLRAGLLEGDEREAFKEMLADARGLSRLEPDDINKTLRNMGGLRDDKSGELQAALGSAVLTMKRGDGLDPDMAREAMEELGYLPQGSTVNDLYAAIGASARGEKVYSLRDAQDIARFEAAQEFRAALDDLGIDITKPLDDIIKDLPGKARNQSAQKGKASEAERSGKVAGEKVEGAEARVLKAIDRLEDAKSRLKELTDDVGPKVREEIKAAQAELKKIIPELKKAKKAQEVEEFYASKDDLEIDEAVQDTIASILNLKPGEHSYNASLSSPTRARVLDIPDEVLEPWLESNVEFVLSQYFRSMVPAIEVARKFGDPEMKTALKRISEEMLSRSKAAKTAKERVALEAEAKERMKDIEGMRDRLLHRYGVPSNPESGWIQGNRALRTVSYMGYLGGMALSAIPDVAGVIGRNGIQDAFGGASTALMDPKRMGMAAKDMAEIGAASEWFLNSRAMSLGEMFDPYGRGTKMERILAQGARGFSIATGMIPWNVGWKSVGGAVAASKMSKAAEAVRAGKATKKQLLKLGENGIEPWMAERIAVQLDRYGDKDGVLWLPRGQQWDDAEAFDAFRRAMNREFDLMVITPGQDKPLSFSTETGKFFLQFKSFAMSAHHRILLSGIQRADADVLAQFTMAVLLGGLVANIKADLGKYDRKEGAAFWEDAIDRSGLTGWLFEPYQAVAAASGGRISISGEPVSRFQARSQAQGVLGPSVDMGVGIYESISAFGSGKATYRDVRKAMRPLPGNNIWYLLPLYQKVEDAVVSATGAKPRE